MTETHPELSEDHDSRDKMRGPRRLLQPWCFLVGHELHSETLVEKVWSHVTGHMQERELATLSCDRCGKWFE